MSHDYTAQYLRRAKLVGQNPNLLFVYNQIQNPLYRILILQGGTRSGKSYSIIQACIRISEENPNAGITFSCVRQSFPVLEATFLRDFIEIMTSIGEYNVKNHRQGNSYQEYYHKGNVFEFFSANAEQKVRGRKRHILVCNEINELNPETYRQLAYRTTGKIIGDFNPSEPDSFVYDELMSRSDCASIVTTYQDNPFLTAGQIRDIEIQAEQNPEEWQVFGLGQRRSSTQQIFTHYRILNDNEWPQYVDERVHGLDFGYVHPSALVEVGFRDGCNFVRELIYERGLTNTALIQKCSEINLMRSVPMYADSARPEYIVEFNNAGYFCLQADKNVLAGIDTIKRSPFYIHEGSKNLIREVKRYKWKKDPHTGILLPEPIKVEDDGMDATRYGIFTHKQQYGMIESHN
jgi:phage terminase large subunit